VTSRSTFEITEMKSGGSLVPTKLV